MILRIKNLEVDIDFSKSDFWTLEIYNPLFLREIFESFSSEDGEENRIHRLLDGENEVDDRFIFVANPFEISGEMSLFSKKMKKYYIRQKLMQSISPRTKRTQSIKQS